MVRCIVNFSHVVAALHGSFPPRQAGFVSGPHAWSLVERSILEEHRIHLFALLSGYVKLLILSCGADIQRRGLVGGSTFPPFSTSCELHVASDSGFGFLLYVTLLGCNFALLMSLWGGCSR